MKDPTFADIIRLAPDIIRGEHLIGTSCQNFEDLPEKTKGRYYRDIGMFMRVLDIIKQRVEKENN